MAGAEKTIKTLEQALLALRYMDLTGLERPLLADSVEKIGLPKLPHILIGENAFFAHCYVKSESWNLLAISQNFNLMHVLFRSRKPQPTFSTESAEFCRS